MTRNSYETRAVELGQLGLSTYQKYLDSDTWKTRRFIYELDHAKRCAWCGSEKVAQLYLSHRPQTVAGRHYLAKDVTDLATALARLHDYLAPLFAATEEASGDGETAGAA